MFLQMMLLPQKGQLAISNTEEFAACLMEKVVHLSFKNKSQMDEMLNKQNFYLQFFFYLSNAMEKEKIILRAYLYDSSCSLKTAAMYFFILIPVLLLVLLGT